MVGLLVIATNKYIAFAENLVNSAQKHFQRNNLKIFLFTNEQFTKDGVTRVEVEHEQWPYMTLKRYHIFNKHAEKFTSCSHLFYCDVDMLFVRNMGSEILPKQGIVATQHPGFVNNKRGSYESRPESTAYVAKNEGRAYYAGGFNGGTKDDFLMMSNVIANNIDLDAKNGLIAVWHDESHLNRYLETNPPSMTLDPGYCYPETWNLPYEKRLIALNKNHAEIRS